ncbi:MAG: 3-deoxy-D-manno-octulosonic acid transferase [Parachlamydia sp.]|nr:MAG: 3-deoxy-D-manno-octulosonic acid transferase [Parachlamydia sp.]
MKKIYAFVYDTLLFILGLALLPWMGYQMLVKGKYRQNFLKRFGWHFPTIQKEGRPLVWIHAVSVGEAKAISGLAEILKKELNHPILVISSVTETGHAEAQRCMPFAEHHVYLPFDLKWIIRPIMRKIAPDLVLLCETDFWFNFLNEAKKTGAFLAVVNGKLSEKSLKRYQCISSFPLFSLIDLYCVQNGLYLERFADLNIPAKKLVVTGNLKCGVIPPKLSESEIREWRVKLGIQSNECVITLGSTHDPEEKKLLESLKGLLEKFAHLKILLVPRHPERFEAVAALLTKLQIPFARYSQPATSNSPARVVLVDAMGVLLKCYQLSDVAVVAGSFTDKVGGHNVLEPSFYGVPVLFGPHMYSQMEFAQLALESGAALQVTETNVAEKIEELLENEMKRKHIGEKGIRLTSEIQGAKEKTWGTLQPHVEQYKAVRE